MAESKQLLGKLLAQQVKQMPANTPLQDVEFSVYSQFGEDGIIQFITHHLQDKIKNKIFVEIGVQNYTEANTRFLLENDAWQGVIFDACLPDIKQIHASDFYWRNNLFAKHAFVTRDNVNSLLTDLQLPSDIGLLSVDIDGNDYWVLQKIEAVKPAIVIVEYNSFFGAQAAISLPYRENFVWQQHHPATYFGASLAAFCFHLENHGYELLGSTIAGNNAFFVNKAVNQGKLRAVSCADGYRKALFNSIPSAGIDKFSHQLSCLQYQQVVDVTDLTYRRLPGTDITADNLSHGFNHKDHFLRLDNEEFLNMAYRYILCREKDICGYLNHLAELKRGVSKEEMLDRIYLSEEGRGVAVHIEGLQQKAKVGANA
jgi:hypothetical protein